MSKLKNILLSVFFSTVPHNQPAAAADKTLDSRARPATKIVKKNEARKSDVPQKKDRFAKYREAEKIALPALIFFEGCSRQAYQDACKIWTVGIGNTVTPEGSPVTAKTVLESSDDIKRYVAAHLEKHIYPYLDDYIKRDLQPHEMAAVISLSYNCGVKALGHGNFRIARAVNSGKTDEIAKAFLTKVATRTRRFSNALAVRRSLEILLYQGNLKLDDINNFYIGGYNGLEHAQITRLKKTKNFYGRIPRTDSAAIEKIKSHCTTAPDPELANSIAWYGGDQKVGDFIYSLDKTRSLAVETAQQPEISLLSLFAKQPKPFLPNQKLPAPYPDKPQAAKKAACASKTSTR